MTVDFAGVPGVDLLADLVIIAAGVLALREHRRHREHAVALGVSWPLRLILIGLLVIASHHAVHAVHAVTALAPDAVQPGSGSAWLATRVDEGWSVISGLVAFACVGLGIGLLIRNVLPSARGWFERLELARAHLAHEVETRREAERRLDASHRDLERTIEERTADLESSNRRLESEISEQRRLTREVEERADFEALIGRVSARLVYVRTNRNATALWEVLREVSQFAGFDRAAIVEASEDRRRFSSLVEWSREGSRRSQPILHGAPRDRFRECLKRLRAGGVLHFESLDRVDESLELDPGLLERDGIRAAAGLPLLVGGRLLGCLVVTSADENARWGQELVFRLKLVADLLATSIQRSRVEADLARQVENYSAIFHYASDAIVIHDPETGRILDANKKTCEMWGYSREQILRMGLPDLSSHDPAFSTTRANELMRRALRGLPVLAEWRGRSAQGNEFWIEVNLQSAHIGDKRLVLATMRDVSERKEADQQRRKLERQLVQSQRIEALGKLAGGVAHDFNNILTVIIGNANLASEVARESDLTDPIVTGCLEEIEVSSERAGALTQQLLAFGRRQIIKPEVMDLNEALADMEGMLRRLINEDVKLVMDVDPRAPRILADSGQIEQVVLNLVVNARDAMPRGGAITIETFGRRVSEADPELGWARGDEVTILAVRDTGCGIEAGSLEHVFEPFFTTKPVGRGTGLGLSTVHGIVKQLGGTIQVISEVDKGSSFEIALRACHESAPTRLVSRPPVIPSSAGERVLVCEDDDKVRELTCSVLRNGGYEVMAASGGSEALQLARATDAPIDALVTDVIMPEMNGRTLAEEMRRERPGLPVLFLSGYPADVLAPYGVMPEEVELVEKPFRAQDLLARVAGLLNA